MALKKNVWVPLFERLNYPKILKDVTTLSKLQKQTWSELINFFHPVEKGYGYHYILTKTNRQTISRAPS